MTKKKSKHIQLELFNSFHLAINNKNEIHQDDKKVVNMNNYLSEKDRKLFKKFLSLSDHLEL